MKIGHTALYVRDLETSAAFFETYFQGKRNHLYHNEKTGFSSYFISFGDSSQLELMNLPQLAEAPAATSCGFAHIAFQLEAKEQVDALTQRLHSDGYAVKSGPRVTGDGYYESCICGPEGNLIEITA